LLETFRIPKTFVSTSTSGRISRLLATLLSWLLLLQAGVTPASSSQPFTKTSARPTWSVRCQPVRLVNGIPIFFRVKPPAQPQSLHATWLGHDIAFFYDTSTASWFALAGVPLDTAPGDYPLALQAENSTGEPLSFQQTLHVFRAKHASVALSVPKKFVEPEPQQLEEIKKEEALKHDTFARSTPDRQWSGRFAPPVLAATSDRFGTERKFNGELQSVHQGLDYRAPAGTPVKAINAGTVILAQPLFFEGNCVVIDHGQGLLSLYMHLSRFDVKEGEAVRRGQKIALSGATGRATGAHLHVAVRWQGGYLDPATLFSLPLPPFSLKSKKPAHPDPGSP
jgi:murein DD-endopeptidase MepM/ murein hydrolase activator NlpD